MKDKILKKIKFISENKFYKLSKITDKNRIFPQKIAKFLTKKEILYLLEYHKNPKKGIDPITEYKFYLNATKYCANIKNYFLVSIGMVGSTIMKYGTKDQIKNYLNKTANNGLISSILITEPMAGSNINEIKTEYKKINNNYVINGEKTWITLGGISKLSLILANGKDGLLLFVADNNNSFKKKELKYILTNKGSHISNIKLKNLKLREKDIIGGNKRLSKIALEYALMNGRVIAALSASAMCSAALEEAIYYAKRREQFGKKIYQYQQIQKIISDVAVELAANFSLIEKSFKIKRKFNQETINYSMITKIKATKNLVENISSLMDIFGANSTSPKYNIERYFRESKGYHFIEGTTQILSQLIAINSIIKNKL